MLHLNLIVQGMGGRIKQVLQVLQEIDIVAK